MVAVAFATASALLSGADYLWPAIGDGQASHATRRAGTVFPRRDETCKKNGGRLSSCPLQGRVDSAKAEELVAGLGFNVESAFQDNRGAGGGRRRRRPTDNAERGDRPRSGEGDEVVGVKEEGTEEGLRFLEKADFAVPAEDRLAFERNGHTVTRGVFSKGQLKVVRPSVMRAFELQEMDALRQKVSVWFGDDAAFGLETAPELRARLKRLAPEEVPFLQVFNMFRKDGPYRETLEKIAQSPRLAHIASQLLGCQRVRLYQDSTFCKRPGDGPTRWHSDLNMAPLDCNDFVTAWIPLEAVPARKEGGSPLVFASRSHRDFALNHWQDSRLREDLTGRYAKRDHAPLAAGDITWHHGWTLHSSPGNGRDRPRTALAVSYLRDGTRLLSETAGRKPDPEDKWSYGDWVADVPAGGVVEHASVPLVWNGGRPLKPGR